MKAFVTGSTGLLGNNLVRALVEGGYEVKALVRSAEKAKKVLGDLDIEFVDGDMGDVAGFAHELGGCDVLFHTAAYFREYYQPGQHEDLLRKINVYGTIKLFQAAEKYSVANIIYASTGGFLDASSSDGPIDESAPYNYNTPNLYFKSKLEAEEAIYRFMETNDLRIIFIMPGVMLGPWDSGPSAVGRQVILDFIERKLPAIPPGGFSFVDARDVADAMIEAVNTGASGERYLVAGEEYYDAGNFFKMLEKVSGVPSPRLRMPYPVMLTLAWFYELMGRITGKPPQFTREGIRTLVETGGVSSQKAIRELGVKFRPLEDTLGDQVNWYREHGYVSE